MALGTAIAIAGLALGAYGTYQQYQSSQKQAGFQAQAISEQRRAEEQRRRSMELDATRRRRELIRRAIAARSSSVNIAANQGAAQPGSSAIPGAFGGIQGRTGVDILGVTQNREIGRSIFDANAGSSYAYQQAAIAGGDAAFGSGLRSLGGAFVTAQAPLNRVGEFFSSSFTPTPSSSYAPPR